MTRLLPWVTVAGVALLTGCATTSEPDWRYSQPYPPPYCDPSQEPCPPPQECGPGQYCAPGAYPPGAYAPAPYPGYAPPEAYGRGDRDEDERWEHDRERGRHERAAPAPPRTREGDRREGDDEHHDRER